MVENSPAMPGFDPGVRNIPWRRKWQPAPVFLPGESHGQRSLVSYSPWGHKESDTTERLTLNLTYTDDQPSRVYSFSGTAIIRYHKLGVWKQQKFILLQFWRPEVQSQRCLQGWAPSKTRVGIFPCLFQLLLAAGSVWLAAAPLHLCRCLHMAFSPGSPSSHRLPSSHKDTGFIGFRSTLLRYELN